MATLVKFRVHPDNDLFAYFPQLRYSKHPTQKTCYSHVGQHSVCDIKYMEESKQATFEEYAALKQELESIGYQLKECK